MDVIYPYKRNRDAFELRYSLRSLCNVKHDRVIVAGDNPRVTSDLVSVVEVGPVSNRFMSSTANIEKAIASDDVSNSVMVMNDDVFILKPIEYRHYHRCTIDEYLDQGGANGEYKRHICNTLKLLKAHGIEDPLFFGLHVPTIYDRDNLRALIRGFRGEEYLLRTLYHNLYKTHSIQRDDVKLYNWQGELKADDYLSTSDGCALNPFFRSWIKETFPLASEYECDTMKKQTGYMTRAMRHSDPRFERILGKIGYKGREMKPAVDDIAALREEYRALVGKKPFGGWDAAKLREKIAGAKNDRLD